MQSQLPTRNRPAPGASAIPQQQPEMLSSMNYPPMPETLNTSDNQFGEWQSMSGFDPTTTSYPDPSAYDLNTYNANMNAAFPPMTGVPLAPVRGNGQLVRRNTNQQLSARGRTGNQSVWQDYTNFGQTAQGGQHGGWDNTDDDEELEQRALLAKKDAQAKRKQIPPFVQKLSSFLDESNNTDLIRWSDDGRSFIVLDEDRFAQTLIPELFKHNNYASFVRQLNMYGFHKKVGLSDNSMKASETKRKMPSEYYNKYFRRGRPELLWLIQKPKTSTVNTKRKRGDGRNAQGDSDDETKYAADGVDGQHGHGPTDGGGNRNQDLTTIPSAELNSLRQELLQLQRQQKFISGALAQIKQQNEQFYRQAAAFQDQHNRHESSINAILTFLATFYKNSLGDNATAKLNDIFAHAIPQGSQPHGNIVDMDDHQEVDMKDSNLDHISRRRLALLPAPDRKSSDATHSGVATVPTSARGSQSPPSRNQDSSEGLNAEARGGTQPGSSPRTVASDSPVLKDDADTPNLLNQIPKRDNIMSAIRAANSNAAAPTMTDPTLDFSSALDHLNSNANDPLTPQQRRDMLSLMARNTNTTATNNALISPNPPPIPNLDNFATTQEQLEMLQKMQEEQASRVQSLTDRLQPLSPTGSIPGLTDGTYFGNNNGAGLGAPGDFDLNTFIHSDDFFENDPTMADGVSGEDVNYDDIDFGLNSSPEFGNAGEGFLEDLAQYASGSKVESVSSEATSPASTVDGNAAGEEARSPSKRRKVG